MRLKLSGRASELLAAEVLGKNGFADLKITSNTIVSFLRRWVIGSMLFDNKNVPIADGGGK
jgi:hypothetical protein